MELGESGQLSMETNREHEELRGLDLVLRHLCNKPVEISSVTNALYALLISQRHHVSSLSRLCLQYLLQKVNTCSPPSTSRVIIM